MNETTNNILDDEYMLVRRRDNAVIINRLFLSETGIAGTPVMATRGENLDLARQVHGWLQSETSNRVSFGRLRNNLLFK